MENDMDKYLDNLSSKELVEVIEAEIRKYAAHGGSIHMWTDEDTDTDRGDPPTLTIEITIHVAKYWSPMARIDSHL